MRRLKSAFARGALALGIAIALPVAALPQGSAVAATPFAETTISPSANASGFRADLIISDALFYDSDAMTSAEIQAFLDQRIGTCQNGKCLNVAMIPYPGRARDVSTKTGNLICDAIPAGNFLVSELIYRTQVACGISAKVILVTLQKEQGLVLKKAPTDYALRWAMGMACPDTSPCDTAFAGLGTQIVTGTRQLKVYKAGAFLRQPGSHFIGWHRNSACGGTTVNIQNYATAALYNYTPYQPNAAALANMSGTGDSCSSYGNRNFWQFYTSWFGSTIVNAEDEAFVNAVFTDFLGRSATSDEVTDWALRLTNRQIDRFGVATELSRSDEWISTVIAGFYRNTLNREPDAGGLQGWITAARSGMPVAQIASAFYASPEYFSTIGQSDYRTWVTDLYQKLLLRAPDQGGLDGWVDALNAGMPRDALAFGFYQSRETLGVRVNALYVKFLGRDGEAGGVEQWMPFVSQKGDLVLAAAIAASDEYYNRAQAR